MLKFVMPRYHLLTRFRRDVRGLAATEFAIILPMVLMMFFGTIEVSSGVAVDRKVTVLTRTLSDLVSQAITVNNTDIANAFKVGASIMTPYSATPIKAKITQIYIDATGKTAKVVWSKATSNTSAHACADKISVPTGLMVPSPSGTYLIMSEVNYDFTPMVDFRLGGTIPTFPLGDTTFTRPRQTDNVINTDITACT